VFWIEQESLFGLDEARSLADHIDERLPNLQIPRRSNWPAMNLRKDHYQISRRSYLHRQTRQWAAWGRPAKRNGLSRLTRLPCRQLAACRENTNGRTTEEMLKEYGSHFAASEKAIFRFLHHLLVVILALKRNPPWPNWLELEPIVSAPGFWEPNSLAKVRSKLIIGF
jgi:hypothetical protein